MIKICPNCGNEMGVVPDLKQYYCLEQGYEEPIMDGENCEKKHLF